MVGARILSRRAEKESLEGGLSRAFFAAMRLGEDLGVQMGTCQTGLAVAF